MISPRESVFQFMFLVNGYVTLSDRCAVKPASLVLRVTFACLPSDLKLCVRFKGICARCANYPLLSRGRQIGAITGRVDAGLECLTCGTDSVWEAKDCFRKVGECRGLVYRSPNEEIHKWHDSIHAEAMHHQATNLKKKQCKGWKVHFYFSCDLPTFMVINYHCQFKQILENKQRPVSVWEERFNYDCEQVLNN